MTPNDLVSSHQAASRANARTASPGMVLALLSAVYGMNAVDRQILALMIEPIKREFGISDTQMGLLTGLTFAVFYAVLGIPIARYAPRVGLRNTVAACTGIFSLATGLSAMATGYGHLVVARVATAVGEAGTTPSSLAILSSLYPPQRRSGAFAIFTIGAQIGFLVGVVIAGVLASRYGWRAGFLAAGIPGLLLAPLILRFVPRDSGALDPGKTGAVLRLLRSGRFWGLALVGGAILFGGGALGAWLPAYLIRGPGLSIETVSLIMGLGIGVFGALITWFTGRLADRMHSSGASRPLLMVATVSIILPLVILFGLWSPSLWPAIVAFVAALAMVGVWQGPVLAQVHDLAEPADRPVVTAVYLMITSTTGLALGPTFVGLVSDFVGQGSSQGLQAGLSLSTLSFPLAALVLVLVARKKG